MDENDERTSDGQSFSRRWTDMERTFRRHGLPEYTPPRFADGTNVYEVLVPLEDELGVEIDFVGFGESADDAWHVRIDSESVAEVDRERRLGGETVYRLGSDEFRTLVRDAVRDGADQSNVR